MKRYIRPPATNKTSGNHSEGSILEARGRKNNNAKIISKRSQRVDIFGPCSLCGFQMLPLWYFAKSSEGSLYLCTKCKERVLANKKNKESQLTRREEKQKRGDIFFKTQIVLTGQVDSNRNKH